MKYCFARGNSIHSPLDLYVTFCVSGTAIVLPHCEVDAYISCNHYISENYFENRKFSTMSWLTGLCNLLTIVCVTGMYFDCRKDGHDCKNGGVCNNSTGSCACINPYFGFNCEVSEARYVESNVQNKGCVVASVNHNGQRCLYDQRISEAQCVLLCKNRGTCYKASSVGCYCPDTHFGSSCENDRASVFCNEVSMNIRIVPYMRFAGLVYIQGHKDDPDCRFTISADPVTEEVIYQLNRGVGSCSLNRSSDTPNLGDITYSIYVVVQYARYFESSLDVKGNVKCTVPSSATTSQKGIIVLEKRPVVSTYRDETYKSPVKLALQKDSGEDLSYPLYVGTEMRLFLTLMDRKRYTGIILQSCSVTDEVSTKLAKEKIDIIMNGCLTKNAEGIVFGNIIYNGDSKEVSVYFTAFRFPRHPSIAFNCEIDLCSDSCIKPVCDSPVGRRKRFSSNPTLVSVILQDNITVTGLSDELERSAPVNHKLNTKQLGTEVIIPLAILLILLVIVLMSSAITVFVRSWNVKTNAKKVDSN